MQLTTQELTGTVRKFSTCLPRGVYAKLVATIRKPYSLAPEGELDRGVMSAWLLECAVYTITGNDRATAMQRFIECKGLMAEFEEGYSIDASESGELL